MELSRRLNAVASLVSPGCRCLADIGTDHAYIPIWLTETGRIQEALAMDVNIGPLLRAEENIRAHGMETKIETRISNGFEKLGKAEADAAVIAGMGGPLTIRILTEGAEIVNSLKECILQPQSEIEKVRAFLLQEGFSFLREEMIEEDGKFYPIMKVLPPSLAEKTGSCREDGGKVSSEIWNATELRYGKLLLEAKHPVLKRYLQREILIRRRILEQLKENDSQKVCRRRRELEDELKTAEKGMDYYVM